MINRFIKIMLCLSICFVQIVSYAGNVSVSDGSAFITKSEMSYELNNLSTRMMQLENSLDSKIDSLVSSYLTRNGVWNGVKQSLQKDKIVDFWSANTYPITYDFRELLKTNELSRGVEYKLRDAEWTLIANCNKSGMLVGSWDVIDGWNYAKSQYSSVGTDGRNYCFFQAGTATNPVCSNSSECSLWIDGICYFSSQPVSSNTLRVKDLSTTSGYFLPKAGKETPMLFVNKGDELKVRYDVAITPQTEDARQNWQNKTFTKCGDAPGVAIVFGDFYIY